MTETATEPLTTPFEYDRQLVISVNVSNFDAGGVDAGFEKPPHSITDVATLCVDRTRYEEGAELALP